MALKQYKPTSPARRGLILVDKSALWKGKPVKALTEGKRKTGGRNNKGHVTSRGIAGERVDVKPGNAMEIGQMPVGTIVHNVELKPGKGGQIARAAGTYVQVVGRDKGMVIVRLNSGEQRYVRADCMATVGAVSNPDNANQSLAKAGRNRWLGKRPLTRGV